MAKKEKVDKKKRTTKEPWIKCPILTMRDKGIEVGIDRQIECINCPAKNCFEELVIKDNETKLEVFRQEILEAIRELKRINTYIRRYEKTCV